MNVTEETNYLQEAINQFSNLNIEHGVQEQLAFAQTAAIIALVQELRGIRQELQLINQYGIVTTNS